MAERRRPEPQQPNQTGGDLVYTTDEIAALLKVKRETVQDWLKSGRLVGFRVGRHWRVRRVVLEAFIQEAEGKQKKPPNAVLEH